MKRLYLYQIPLRNSEKGLREGLVLNWGEGWGEIAPLPGWSRETLEEARAEILRLLPNLETARPFLPSVRFGLACASKPFPKQPLQIPLCALNPTAEHRGFTTAKIKLKGLSLEEAIHKTQEAKKQFRLRIDCNRSWTLDEALAFARYFRPADFEYLEEPVRTFEELVAFSEKTRFPIAVDESANDPRIQNIPTLKAIVAKPTLLGNLPSPPRGVDLVLSSSYETGLGLLHIAQWAQELGLTLPMGLDTHRYLGDDLLASPLKTEGGYLSWQSSTHSPIQLEKLCLIASAP